MGRRGLSERFAAWIYTGPLGHLWGALADISEMWLRWMWSRVRTRLRTGLRAMR
jgi:hypothetical protein